MKNNDNNKLIAQFMGATCEEVACFHANVEQFTLPKGQVFPTGLNEAWINHLCYHSSFDWIMPVVEKIVKMGWIFTTRNYIDNSAKFSNDETFVNAHSWSTPLLATYNVVIDFIKLYNEGKI